MSIGSLIGLIVASSFIGAHIIWRTESLSEMLKIIDKEKEDKEE